ncbi:MAG: ABC transporter permease [Myxococcota bacterium]|nr:FtsX-like permease family protein [Myxococcota bacterium]
MNIPLLAARNVTRNKLRTVLTTLGVAVTVLTFLLIRTVVAAWYVGVEAASKDRIATRHKVSFIMQLPKHYADTVRQVPGVQAATWAQWFGGKEPNHEGEFFATLAVEAKTTLDVYDELVVPEDQKRAWLEDRQGILAGDVIAKKFGWKVGDRVNLSGTIYPGDWQFTVDAIYTAARKSIDRSTVFFHWDYLNESLPEARRDRVGWIVSRIDDPAKSAAIQSAIDATFDSRDIQTLSQSERDLNNSFLGMMSAVLGALDIVSVVILVIMGLILGNTIAMGVRERTTEYGVMRALGFTPRHIATFVLSEAFTLGIAGGALGLAIAYPFVNQGVGAAIEENMGAFFPYFRILPDTAITAMILAVVLALVGSIIPAWQASRLRTIDALRQVG